MPPQIATKVAVVYRLKTSIVLLFGLYREILVFSNLLIKCLNNKVVWKIWRLHKSEGVYMTSGRLSPWSEFSSVHSHGSILNKFCLHDPPRALFLSYVGYHQKMSCKSESPSVSSPWFLYQRENFTAVRNVAAVSCKRETTTRFSMKSVCQ